jgi:hypothetical protein
MRKSEGDPTVTPSSGNVFAALAGLSQIWGGAAPVEAAEGLLNKRFTSIACLAFHR